MAVPIQSQIFNPVSGVFGTGQMQIFGAGMSGSWTVPPGIGKVRARCFGGGGYGGGGFAIKAVYDLAGITSIPVTVAGGGVSGIGSTSSFGSYVSATGGTTTGGSGLGGDINASGGYGTSGQGGGVGNLFGQGGSTQLAPFSGSSGAAQSTTTLSQMNGFLGSGGGSTSGTVPGFPSASGMNANFSIDFIGTGGGGSQGANGGGGIQYGGYPGGGGNTTGGAPGMVIVEW